MKTWKHFTFGAILAIVFIFTACDDGNGNTHTHEWGEWVVTTLATVTIDGVETKTCTTCGQKENQPIAALATPFFGIWSDNNESLTRTMNINRNNIRYDQSDGKYWVIEPIWTPITNNNILTKDTYPNGYDFKGSLIIESNYLTTETSDDSPLFMNNDKQSFIIFDSGGLTFYKK
jgi:hypothetical protein